MRKFIPIAALALVVAFLAAAPAAQVPLDGYFIAFEACPATPSTKRPDNPGNVTTETMRAYEMLGINKSGGAFFRIRVPGAPDPKERWVRVGCGAHVVEAGTAVADDPGDGGTPPVTGETGPEWTDNMLTLSWQPAFCESSDGRRKSECKVLNDGGLPHAAAQLSIHGLWPQPNGTFYCGVPSDVQEADKSDPVTGAYDALPEVAMDADTRARLERAMPGMASGLEKHEWVKHGTCYRAAGGSDEYYDDTLFLAEAINSAGLAEFLAGRLGQMVTVEEIQAEFDRAFGPGAGAAVEVRCSNDGNRRLVGELWIALEGVISEASDIGDLMRAAPPRSSRCDGGIVDPAGLQ